jgi:hypothetical protein
LAAVSLNSFWSTVIESANEGFTKFGIKSPKLEGKEAAYKAGRVIVFRGLLVSWGMWTNLIPRGGSSEEGEEMVVAWSWAMRVLYGLEPGGEEANGVCGVERGERKGRKRERERKG